MFKYFIFSDVHGEFDVLDTSLRERGYNPDDPSHVLMSLGDLFDRGEQNLEVYRFLKTKIKYAVLGNHDSFLLDYLDEVSNGFFDVYYNGMGTTLSDLSGLHINKENMDMMRYQARSLIIERHGLLRKMLKTMPHGYKLENLILTHAGFTNVERSTVLRRTFPDYWAQTPKFIESFKDNTIDAKFVFGHWHAGKLTNIFYKRNDDEHEMFVFKNFIGLDAATNLTKRVNILIVESEKEPVPFTSKDSVEDILKM